MQKENKEFLITKALKDEVFNEKEQERRTLEKEREKRAKKGLKKNEKKTEKRIGFENILLST